MNKKGLGRYAEVLIMRLKEGLGQWEGVNANYLRER